MINTSFPVKGLILDMDGVLWKDTAALLDMPAFFAAAQKEGLRVVLATNNSTRTVEQYQEKIKTYGVMIEPWQIINSGMAVVFLLKQKHPNGAPVFIVGEQGLHETLKENGFFHNEENPVAVVASIDRRVNFEKLRRATLLIRSGLPFIGTNPDRTFPTPEGLVPGSGSILALLQAASDVAPIIAGKPEPFMFQLAMERLGTSPDETLAIGDRMDTDVLGGQRAGCRTGAVLSGVSSLADVEAWSPRPDWIANNLADLIS